MGLEILLLSEATGIRPKKKEKRGESLEIKSKEIKFVPIEQIIPNPKNPNKHPQDQIERLSKIIDFQGFRVPLIISNRSGFLVSGHGRLECAKHLKIKELPVMYQDFESEAQEYAFVVSDNEIQKWASTDLSMVNMEMLDLGPDFDIDLLAIKDFVIEPIEKFEPQSDEDEVPEVAHPITRRGDVWLLGNHRLMCGDSTMIDDVEKLMNGEKADMVFTDPPYNVNYESDHSGKIKNDKMSDKDFEQFIRDTYTAIDFACADNASIYICHATMVVEFDTVLREMDWAINNKIIWVKDIPTFTMAKYKWKYEPIHFCLKGSPKFYGDKTQVNVWEIKSIQSAGNSDEMGNTWFKGGSKNLTLHPTQKPYQLPLKAIENSSKKGDLLFEPFSGSGSTLVASEGSGRRCFAMELDEKFADVCIKRWELFAGKKATLELTGQTYEELKAERDLTQQPD